MSDEGRDAASGYFRAFDHVRPPMTEPLSRRRAALWQFLAALTLGFGVWYLHWRWTSSLNEDALLFSAIVAGAETAMFFGTLLFFFDIWDEGDTPQKEPPATPADAYLPADSELSVDVFIATYDEHEEVLEATLEDALKLELPAGWRVEIYVLDDGNRATVASLAERYGVNYIARQENLGFKAGNMRNALFQTDGEFVLICDADTRLFPDFLVNTLGYFRDPSVAWVQTPHWFYDIPEGQPWAEKYAPWLARLLSTVSGSDRTGRDPFLSGSLMFFDVIQRRRNRNGASFCCGAGSIHRRDPIFQDALHQHQSDRQGRVPLARRDLAARLVPLQPFRFHVSEDIYTSMLLHGAGRGWRSVYHPQIECRMLSPWSMDAWASQKLKYAGGTLDLMLRANPLLNEDMPWRVRLHYAATFWSYLNAIALIILLVAPVYTLSTGTAPVDAYSLTFFLHLLPLLLANEAALAVASKGQDANQGRILSLGTLPIVARAIWLAVRGKKVRFRPTPKTPMFSGAVRFVLPNIYILIIMAAALMYGVVQHVLGSEAHSASLLIVNAFWLTWCGLSIARPVAAAFWRPDASPKGAATLASGLHFFRKIRHAKQRKT
ncbi:MAG: cellulose synthase catalytic subunit [Pseudomonadota bacterium]